MSHLFHSESATGAAQEGAGLQIGGTAGSGSAGIASIVLGDAGSGQVRLTLQGWFNSGCIYGSISDGGQRFASLVRYLHDWCFHEIMQSDTGAQDQF